MNRQHSTLNLAIGATAAITLVYLLSVLINVAAGVVLGLFGLTCIATVWMVIRILKDPYSTDKTFDGQFYQDRNDLKRNGTESYP